MIDGKAWVLIMMLIGSLMVIVYKFQNSIYIYEGPAYKQNFHPYLQTLSMFMGEMLSLPIFLLIKKRNAAKYAQKQRIAIQQGKKINMNRFFLFVPAFFDLLTSTMQFFALNFIPTSAYQMLKGGSIITTFFFSVVFLKQPIIKRQLIGSLLALLGVLVVGLANTIFTFEQSSSEGGFLQIFGYFLMLGSLFTNGFFFVFQQKLLDNYHLQPLQVVGYEGLYGFIMYSILVPIFCHVPCSLGPSACVYSQEGRSYMEGWSVYWKQMGQNPTILVLGIISVIGIFGFNLAGVTVTKKINALARAIANMTKSIFVWILGLIVTVTFGSVYPNFKWEKLQVLIIIMQTIGFILMAGGNFIYNGILKIPCVKQGGNTRNNWDEVRKISDSNIVTKRLINNEQRQNQ